MLRTALFAFALLTAGCASEDPNESSAADRVADRVEETVRDIDPLDIEADGLRISTTVDGDAVESILTTDGQMEMGLTNMVLYSRLSKETQAEVTAEMESAADDHEGLGGRIARAVTDAVAQSVGTAVQVPVADVADVRVEGGRIVVEMADGETSAFDNLETDGVKVLEAFSRDDAQRLADAFGRLKSAQ